MSEKLDNHRKKKYKELTHDFLEPVLAGKNMKDQRRLKFLFSKLQGNIGICIEVKTFFSNPQNVEAFLNSMGKSKKEALKIAKDFPDFIKRQLIMGWDYSSEQEGNLFAMKSPDGKGFIVRASVLTAIDELIAYLNNNEPSPKLKNLLKKTKEMDWQREIIISKSERVH